MQEMPVRRAPARWEGEARVYVEGVRIAKNCSNASKLARVGKKS